MRNKTFLLLRVLTAALLVLAVCAASCGSPGPGPSEPDSQPADTAESSLAESSEPVSEEVSAKVNESSEDYRSPIPENATVYTNLDFRKNGKMGDADGPAVCYYSKTGYRKASMDVHISDIAIRTKRPDRRFVNAYMFLGCDIFNGSYWCNCFDAGFCWSGSAPSWHLFYNIYEPADKTQRGWYESGVKLSRAHDYRLILDTSEEDEKATIIVYDLTDDREADRAVFRVKNMKCDGSNTAYLMDFALDYPDNVRKDTDGKTTDDWKQITLYNTDQNLYMTNILVDNVKILPAGTDDEIPWDESVTNNRGLWPDKSMTEIDYVCTQLIELPSESGLVFRVDLDMNRHSEE